MIGHNLFFSVYRISIGYFHSSSHFSVIITSQHLDEGHTIKKITFFSIKQLTLVKKQTNITPCRDIIVPSYEDDVHEHRRQQQQHQSTTKKKTSTPTISSPRNGRIHVIHRFRRYRRRLLLVVL
mmetsp:Transcript_13154/g.25034  ORF Transcript_13154/g.25034 Transcript_13154/m.25034 type:complete len:124 (+) Transcript_13154:3-374(+)